MTKATLGARTPELTVAEAFGQRTRALRTDRGWTQLQVAEGLTIAGLKGWRRATVTALEAGDRQITVEEALVIAHVFGVPVVDLLPLGPEPEEASREHTWILRLGPDAVMVPAIARWHLTGGHEGQEDYTAAGGGIFDEASTPAYGSFLMERDDANIKAAKVLGIGVKAVVALAECLWTGLTLPRERDRRLREQGDVDLLSPRSLQGRRGHITRGLLTELRTALEALPKPITEYDRLDELGEALRAAKVLPAGRGPGHPVAPNKSTTAKAGASRQRRSTNAGSLA